jgi:hypothetical protein
MSPPIPNINMPPLHPHRIRTAPVHLTSRDKAIYGAAPARTTLTDRSPGETNKTSTRAARSFRPAQMKVSFPSIWIFRLFVLHAGADHLPLLAFAFLFHGHTWSPAGGAAAAQTAGSHVPRGAKDLSAVRCSGRRRLRAVQGRG